MGAVAGTPLRRGRAPLGRGTLVLMVSAASCIFLTLNFLLAFTYITGTASMHTRLELDVVYTWVNGSDPSNAAARAYYKGHGGTERSGASIDASTSRYQDDDQLMYSLRSVQQYMPWVRKVWVVVANADTQVPHWLRTDIPDKLEIVTHQQIWRDPSQLPVFNSKAIEANIHRIPGLSEFFVYLNDDYFFGSPTSVPDFVRWVRASAMSSASSTPSSSSSSSSSSTSSSSPSLSTTSSSSGSSDRVAGAGDVSGQYRHYVFLDGQVTPDAVEYQDGRNDLSPRKSAFAHSNVLLDQRFGSIEQYPMPDQPVQRREIRHAPVIINRRWMAICQSEFEAEFNQTSGHRFREQRDISVTFTYAQYVLHRGWAVNANDRWQMMRILYLPVSHHLERTEYNMNRARWLRPWAFCLNDDLNRDKPTAEAAAQMMRDLLQWYFPYPSQYEKEPRATSS